jgi:CheY-like chemotaxis protein
VAGVYNRAKDLRDKVETILLKKIEWQILFSVDGKRTPKEIAAKVQRDENFVSGVLASLAQKTLIVGDGIADNGAAKTEKKPKAEAVPDVKKPEPKKEEPKVEQKKAEPPKDVKPEPVKETPKAETKAKATPAPTGKAGGRKILVVDDSIVIQKMVEIALENEQVQLSAAMKGEDAVRVAQEFQPALILLDIMLPDMSGLDVMKQIRALGGNFESVPIVVLSGKDSPQDKDTALSNGANDFLTKPFHDEDLLSKVHEYVG